MADFRGYMIGSFASSRLDRGGVCKVSGGAVLRR